MMQKIVHFTGVAAHGAQRDTTRQRTRMMQKIVHFTGVAAHDAICIAVEVKQCSAHFCIRISARHWHHC